MINDLTIGTMHGALRGLAARQRAIADNISNVETPGFLASRVDFESALRAAVTVEDAGEATATRPTTLRSLEPTRANGNNVNLDEETVANIDTQLRYQLVVTALNNRIGSLRSAIRGEA